MAKSYPTAQNPLMLRSHRLMEAFAKSDDERDFFLDRVEGFIFFADLDKPELELSDLHQEIEDNPNRYCLIPKMTFYETKKFMEGFVNEKVYDIDTKEKLLDIIQSKEARENFLEFIYDHLTESEKWQQYYQERSRIRIIEWLRQQNVQFVFEEDLDLTKTMMEKLKRHLFDGKVAKDISQAREALFNKAKTYYSNEALNPRPKRGRPPKQVAKIEIEPQVCVDLYTTVPPAVRPFLFIPDIQNASAMTFSAKYKSEKEFIDSLRGGSRVKDDSKLNQLAERLSALKKLSMKFSVLPDTALVDGETRALKDMAVRIDETLKEGEQQDQKRVSGVFQGFLPGKKDPAAPKEKPTVKTVTSINIHKPKKTK